MASTPLLDVNSYVTIPLNEETPLSMSRASKFIGSETLTGLTDRKIIHHFYPSLSNCLLPARGYVEPANKKKSIRRINDCSQSIVSVIRGLTPRTGRQTYWNREWQKGTPSTYHWYLPCMERAVELNNLRGNGNENCKKITLLAARFYPFKL
jgi:hypothetical protein